MASGNEPELKKCKLAQRSCSNSMKLIDGFGAPESLVAVFKQLTDFLLPFCVHDLNRCLNGNANGT
ncbi:MAG: hypothetical protein JWP96_1997 [Polaromonas sp.]|nr:hypothetical protein [Polaromonas sp.]